MPLIENLSQYGIIKDVPAYAIPLNAWSDGNNVRMHDHGVEKFFGYQNAYAANGLPDLLISPLWMTSIVNNNDVYWVFASETEIYASDWHEHYELTRTSGVYSADVDIGWTGGAMGGVVYLNNGVDIPQQWVSPPVLSTRMTDLSNWPALVRCRSLRSHKQYMIAMDVTKSGTRYPRMVKWSHSSSSNSVPSSWDETDATLDAGEYELVDTSGAILDGQELGDMFIIYKEDSIWGMQFIGPPLIWRFFKISEVTGALNRRCIATFPGGHFVFGQNDCFVVDGHSIKSIFEKRVRREVFDNFAIDPNNRSKAFVVQNFVKSEMWACYTEYGMGATYATRAVVWNWNDNTITFRSLPEVAFIGAAPIPLVATGGDSLSWAGSPAWDDRQSRWDSSLSYDPTVKRMIFCVPSPKGVYVGDSENTENNIAMTSYVERSGLHFGSPKAYKFCSGITINMLADSSVNIYVGYHDSPEDSVTWKGPFTFDPRSDHKIDCRVTGRYLAFKVESTTDMHWRLFSYDMNIEVSGTR